MNAVVQRRTARDEALQKLALEEFDAWFEYLEACRGAGERYAAVEVWAWSRLQQRLRAADARRRSLQRKGRAA